MARHNNRHYAIGVFDSGLGGLTVVKELVRLLPHEDIVYFGDTARVPYGTKSKESIIRFSKENVGLLLKHKVKMIVLACNTSSSLALDVLKRTYGIPLIGVINPGAQKAVLVTKNKRIGVVATSATIYSQAYPKRIRELDRSIKVIAQACPLFVPLAEEGWFNKKVTEDIARTYLKNMIKNRIDALILGCTHYPLLKPVLRKVMGKKVFLVDSAEVVANEVKKRLVREDKLNPTHKKGYYKFLVSDRPQHFQELAKRFLGFDIKNVLRV